MDKKLVFFLITAIILLLILLILIKPTITGNATAPVTEQGKISLYFCPYENCSTHLIDAINTANVSIDCALFDLNLKPVAHALSQKTRAIPVRIVFDNENEKHVAAFAPSFSYIFDNDNQLSHN